ncbi:MAG TPA: thiamine pyrophosphate-binding protein [Burkholderiales bacterium]|jgi:benzoylformate decarboxylase|nr:thiamine pyrophosphate-binding protein [Burkholderiales bacterium]
MRGRDVFIQSLVLHGVKHIFGNPGTTESPLLDALSDCADIEYITHLHEGVAVGAASYYARATGRTAVVSLHAAPGLGNGIGMMYGAAKANAPVIVTAGQQDTRMLRRDPLLAHDLAAIAAPVAKWSAQVQCADEMDEVMRRAFKVANDPPHGPVFVALPIDVMEQETRNAAQAPGRLYREGAPDAQAVAAACELMRAARAPVIVVGDEVGRAGAMGDLVRLAERIGAPVWFEGIRGHVSFPGAHPQARTTLPFDAAAIRKTLGDADLVLLVGGRFFEEIWFSPGSPFPQGAKLVQIESSAPPLAHNYAVDVGLVATLGAALRALDGALAAQAGAGWLAAAAARRAQLAGEKAQDVAAYQTRLEKAWARMPISMPRAMAELRRATPAEAVVVEESITASIDLAANFQYESADQYLGARGGGIGQGLAGAIGAAIGHRGRPVLCVSGDGSAMYSIQALWTAAHHRLPIVFVILANREYRVLKHNLDLFRQRFDAASGQPYPHMDLGDPPLGFVEMAAGMGVHGVRVSEPGALAGAIEQAFAARAPRVVEIVVEGKR